MQLECCGAEGAGDWRTSWWANNTANVTHFLHSPINYSTGVITPEIINYFLCNFLKNRLWYNRHSIRFWVDLCLDQGPWLLPGHHITLPTSYARPSSFFISVGELVWRAQTTVCMYCTRYLKNCANLFLPELRQIYTNFDKIWQKDGKEAKIIWGVFIFHLWPNVICIITLPC